MGIVTEKKFLTKEELQNLTKKDLIKHIIEKLTADLIDNNYITDEDFFKKI